jgi:DNA-binding transcriptional MerR regulator
MIRFYEKQGMFEDMHISRAENNYWHYTDDVLQRVLLIKQGQAAGFTLADTRTLLRLWFTDEMSDADKAAIIVGKIVAIEGKIAELTQMKTQLMAKLAQIGTTPTEAYVQTAGQVGSYARE